MSDELRGLLLLIPNDTDRARALGFLDAERAERDEAEGDWSAYAVAVNQRLERVIELAMRRGVDRAAITAALAAV